MQTGESAGFAAALAVKEKTTPAQLDPHLLIRLLANRQVMISFFNDVDVTSGDPRVPAAQYFGTQGFFHDYNARLDEPLKDSTAKVWQEAFAKLGQAGFDSALVAKQVAQAESAESALTSRSRGEVLAELFSQLN